MIEYKLKRGMSNNENFAFTLFVKAEITQSLSREVEREAIHMSRFSKNMKQIRF